MDERTMTDPSTLPLIVLLPICFLGGLFIGYGYFRALRETANLIVKGGNPLRAIVLTLARISLLATGFFIAMLAGGLALLATFAGVLCAKWIMLRRIGDIQT
ncbi:ATP synthase subunit I [Antarctobacter heliothermus]|uniref:N-ATPase, AtpR subunit n=1 Tax=Antarctobacter heliothermus TaxID=74033 RepID=A0A239K5Y5_9RHOB|nr:ATP synthase subunit I [Antarctobacter heliothermus]SNT13411.1 N-ATPase, AtpR subunit [Antarctobacter heliothermus]